MGEEHPCSRCEITEERRGLVESHAPEECVKCGEHAMWLIECVKKVTWIEGNSKIRKGCEEWDGCKGCTWEAEDTKEWPCSRCRRRYIDYYTPE